MITTTMLNVSFDAEILAFMQPKTRVTPIAVIGAMSDLLKANGPSWLQSDESKALLHFLHTWAYGTHFKLESDTEDIRLRTVFANRD